jgi:hypothetical protein
MATRSASSCRARAPASWSGRATRRRGRDGGAETLARGGRGGTPAAGPAGCWTPPQPAIQRRLFLPEGRAALDYLRGRGLTDDTIRRFGLGWSGEGRGAVAADLAREGVDRNN